VLVKWLRAAVQIQGTHRNPHASFENHKTIPENNVLLPAFPACLVFLFCSLNVQINETLTLTLIRTNSSSACLTSQISPLFSLVSTKLTVASYQEHGSDSENEILHTRDTVDNQKVRHRSRAKNESSRPKNHTQKGGKTKDLAAWKRRRAFVPYLPLQRELRTGGRLIFPANNAHKTSCFRAPPLRRNVTALSWLRRHKILPLSWMKHCAVLLLFSSMKHSSIWGWGGLGIW